MLGDQGVWARGGRHDLILPFQLQTEIIIAPRRPQGGQGNRNVRQITGSNKDRNIDALLIPLRCEARLHHHVDDPRHRRSTFAFLQVCGKRRALRIQLRGREQFLAGLLAIGGIDTQA